MEKHNTNPGSQRQTGERRGEERRARSAENWTKSEVDDHPEGSAAAKQVGSFRMVGRVRSLVGGREVMELKGAMGR